MFSSFFDEKLCKFISVIPNRFDTITTAFLSRLNRLSSRQLKNRNYKVHKWLLLLVISSSCDDISRSTREKNLSSIIKHSLCIWIMQKCNSICATKKIVKINNQILNVQNVPRQLSRIKISLCKNYRHSHVGPHVRCCSRTINKFCWKMKFSLWIFNALIHREIYSKNENEKSSVTMENRQFPIDGDFIQARLLLAFFHAGWMNFNSMRTTMFYSFGIFMG